MQYLCKKTEQLLILKLEDLIYLFIYAYIYIYLQFWILLKNKNIGQNQAHIPPQEQWGVATVVI